MHTESELKLRRSSFRIPIWLGFCLFSAIALFLLWEEHKAHILGALPYVLALLCPLIHLFMHGRYGGHDHGSGGHDSDGRAARRHEGDLS